VASGGRPTRVEGWALGLWRAGTAEGRSGECGSARNRRRSGGIVSAQGQLAGVRRCSRRAECPSRAGITRTHRRSMAVVMCSQPGPVVRAVQRPR
jgi:hypothetical protein